MYKVQITEVCTYVHVRKHQGYYRRESSKISDLRALSGALARMILIDIGFRKCKTRLVLTYMYTSMYTCTYLHNGT